MAERSVLRFISEPKTVAGALVDAGAGLAIHDKVLPPTMNLHKADPECDLDNVPNKMRVGDK